MIPAVVHPCAPDRSPPTVPGWAVPRGAVTSDAEAAFFAGSALNSLDNLVRSDPAWAGAWRQRLALKCAAAAVSVVGRAEDEGALRDAWHLRQPGDDPGPAGNILAAWKRLAGRSPGVDLETLRSTVALLGLRWSDELAPLVDRVGDLARTGAPAPFAAAAIAGDVQALRADADLLGWWLADQVLALRLRWPLPVPILIAQARSSAFRGEGSRGRIRPGGEGFQRAVCVALAQAAVEACRLAGDVADRAARLEAVAPKLRAKGAGEAIRLLLDDDAVPGTLQTAHLSRWGARRLFERLETLGAVRELSGRPAFRLYGL
ncbi:MULTISPECIES: DUF1403 family protein [Parvibaculum]|uniref:DUF1403 family protein n=1 Tax=Parvibaculum TaxID=256616 RepID=UPI000C56731B|nr:MULTISPECIES: DUF1403 family protein [Parvibaculum]MAM93329.1 hypothetical protein [Parvibaculum sp.]NIJ42808.1 hypothetical protein [Parvibaculum indicum]|tara:strand:- start:8002 stop:8955 length:954 start_codon:yes stop_codon:yes gene_type:complete